ncbi:ribonuclease BN [Metallosphaera tengchongensis]|uniref:Ribonuclease BN n=2 Tax=Metallosphaera tengchongensis TaxID=1532350 RepID=A0A6N0NW75_9CREN|nr:ribonuclease BN [Metallosphaera tengchongensis]
MLNFDNMIWNKLVVYLDLRMKGKKVSFLNLGSSLGISDKSNKLNAIVFTISENENIDLNKVIEVLSFAKTMRIEALMAIVDKYGDITYYNLEEISLHK